jgi:hypothetical protein
MIKAVGRDLSTPATTPSMAGDGRFRPLARSCQASTDGSNIDTQSPRFPMASPDGYKEFRNHVAR